MIIFVVIKKCSFFDIIFLVFLQMVFHSILSGSFLTGSSSLKASVTSFEKLVLIPTSAPPSDSAGTLAWAGS